VAGAEGAGHQEGGVPLRVAGREREYGGREWVEGGAGVRGHDDERVGGGDEYG